MPIPRKGSKLREVQLRRLKISKLMRRGIRNLRELSEIVGVGTGQVCKDIQAINDDLGILEGKDAAIARDRLVAELLEVRREAWEAWEKSKEASVKNKASRKAKGEGADAGTETTTERTVEEKYGDPRFLSVILNCNEREARLLGLDAPEKFELQATLQATEVVIDGPGQIASLKELIERAGYVPVAELPNSEEPPASDKVE